MSAPLLPKKKAAAVIMQNTPEANSTLRAFGISVLHPVPDPLLPEETADHADMLACAADTETAFLAPGQNALRQELESRGFACRETAPLGKSYPADVRLNVAVTEDLAVGNFRYADPHLTEHLKKLGKRLLHVRQGYAKCSLCFVTNEAFITEDAGIHAALLEAGRDVLLIRAGGVRLSRVHHGFFGGATGLIAPDRLAVSGDLQTLPDGERVVRFLEKYGVSPVSLRPGPVTDVGGILTIG